MSETNKSAGKTLRIHEVKKALQHFKKTLELMKCVNTFSLMPTGGIQMGAKELREVAQMFRMEIQKVDSDSDSWSGAIWVEGIKLYSYKYNFDHKNSKSYFYTESKKDYKQAFFEADGDKEKAFALMKSDDNKNRYPRYKNYHSLSDLEKHWRRNEVSKTIEQYYQEYAAYRNDWKVTESENDDYYIPFTFQQWYQIKR